MIAGSTPTAALFGQQPWASCSHLMCLCSPSSITWYLARAFMLMRRNVARNKGSIVERLCSDLDCKEPRYKSPTLLYFTLFSSASIWIIWQDKTRKTWNSFVPRILSSCRTTVHKTGIGANLLLIIIFYLVFSLHFYNALHSLICVSSITGTLSTWWL